MTAGMRPGQAPGAMISISFKLITTPGFSNRDRIGDTIRDVSHASTTAVAEHALANITLIGRVEKAIVRHAASRKAIAGSASILAGEVRA